MVLIAASLFLTDVSDVMYDILHYYLFRRVIFKHRQQENKS